MSGGYKGKKKKVNENTKNTNEKEIKAEQSKYKI